MRRTVMTLLLAAAVAESLSGQRAGDSLEKLAQQHRWFELRKAIGNDTVAPLYSGLVAAAFNQRTVAERQLRRAIAEAPDGAKANDAREALLSMLMRDGRSADMVRLLDEAVAATPSRDDIRNVRDAFSSLRSIADQKVSFGQRRDFGCVVSTSGVRLPATVNGRPVEWLFDTAFSHTSLTLSEARGLGISTTGDVATAEDFNGNSTSMQPGVARRMTVGDVEFQNVPVLVFPDTQPAWTDLPTGKKGAIGLPIALAAGGISWTRGGVCTLGSNSSRLSPSPNLAFDGSTPIIRSEIDGKPVDLVLDSGNQGGTQLWERFRADFPERVRTARPGKRRIEQIGGAMDVDVLTWPELQVKVAGRGMHLRPANLFSKPVGDDNMHGNLGVDALMQASVVTIDFRAMTIRIR